MYGDMTTREERMQRKYVELSLKGKLLSILFIASLFILSGLGN